MVKFHVDQGIDSKTKLAMLGLLKSKKLGRRLLSGLVFVFALTLFLHYQEVRIDILELGSLSDRYVIAQVDFDLPDEEATALLRQESTQDVGFIYKLDEAQLTRRIREAREHLIKHDDWRLRLPKTSSEELFRGVEQIKDLLFKQLFTDPRTMRMSQKASLDLGNFNELSAMGKIDAIVFDEKLWNKVKDALVDKGSLEPELFGFLVQLLNQEPWRLQEDRKIKNTLLCAIQEEVPTVYSTIKAGSRLVDRGERVTERHLEMLSSMKQAMMSSRNLWQTFPLLGSSLLALVLTTLSVVFFRAKHLDLLRSPQKLTLLITIMISTLVIAKTTEYILLRQENNLMEYISYPLFVPLASLLVSVLLGTQVALFVSSLLSIILSLSLAFDHERFLIVNLTSGLLTIIFASQMHKRKDLFSVSAKVWLCTLPVLVAYHLSQHNLFSVDFLFNVATTFGFMLAIALVVAGLLPVLESRFCVMTDMSLMEYMDPNNELLRRLSVEAPGTYQHSLVVGHLAEAAAQSIQANALFCRVSSLYHDVGKLFNPHYFTENRLGGLDLHQLLTPSESSQVIIAHVSEGETLARKQHLPQGFVDVIRSHHGTSCVYFFYCKQLEQAGGDPSKVDVGRFRYQGVKPHTREEAIIMIADSVEAASRSLSELSEQVAVQLVDRIIKEKIEEGQFEEAHLTFEELSSVKRSLVKALLVTHHLRVKYPTQPHIQTVSFSPETNEPVAKLASRSKCDDCKAGSISSQSDISG